ncbi:MAG TPA: hypothetical protein VLC46_02230 [Thermoanaerobaculia bacterium]|jgi:hypothetical protein|nr:hypothetical protein [Thermoanaerobaculia bacterium]
MRRLVPILVLLVAVAAGHHYYRGTYAPVSHYKAFAEEILHRHYDAAAEMSEGLTAADLGKLGSQERIGAGPPMFQTIFPSRFAIESRDAESDGAITINAVQTVLFNPAGVESAVRPAMYATLRQVTKLRNGDHGWKVIAFSNTFEKMDSLTGR